MLGTKHLPHAPLADLVENGVLAEPEPPPAGEYFAGLKRCQQSLRHESLRHRAVPGLGIGGPGIDYKTDLLLRRHELSVVKQPTRQGRLAKPQALGTVLFGGLGHGLGSLPTGSRRLPADHGPVRPRNRLGKTAAHTDSQSDSKVMRFPVAGWVTASRTACRARPPVRHGNRLP